MTPGDDDEGAFDLAFACGQIMEIFPQYKLHELLPPHMDGEQFFTLLSLVPRMSAKRVLDQLRAVQMGMGGGDGATEGIEDLLRVMQDVPKIRLKAEYQNVLSMMTGKPVNALADGAEQLLGST